VADQAAQDYTATLLTYTISGTVTVGSNGLAGVTMAGLPGSPVTGPDGTYSGIVNYGFSGTVTPTLESYAFEPASRAYSPVSSNQLYQDFAATRLVVTVTSPNGGETWAMGTKHDITWTQTGMTGPVTIDLYKGGVWKETLGTPPATAGTFIWTIASTETIGADYAIRVWQSGTSDESDLDFSLVRKFKVDFNKDGQEDLLWRYQGSGGYQGMNVAWLMNQTQGLSPLTLGAAQNEPGATNLLMGTAPGNSYVNPIDTENSKTLGPDRFSATPLEVGNPQARRPKKIMMNPMDDLPLGANGRTLAKNLVSVPVIKDGENASPASSGTMEIASLVSNQEVLLTTIPDIAWEIVGTGDLNGDGNTDILWRNYGSGGYQGWNLIWYMEGTTIKNYGYLPTILDTNWRIAGTGDFDGNGNLDILWRYQGSGGYQGWNIIWYMSGETIMSQEYPPAILDTNWKIDGIGDFNGDGKSDMLWRYYGSGGYQGWDIIWYMNGTAITSQENLDMIWDTNWRIDGTGDFDGDGKADILWRYYGSGGYEGWNIVWYMNGTTIKSQENLPIILKPDPNWRIVNR
jgi:hypothetical protein